jgi:hypothetical protein
VATTVEAAATMAANTMVVVATRTRMAAAAAIMVATRTQLMAAAATMVTAAHTVAVTTPAMMAPKTKADNPPRQSSTSTTGTTAARMVVMWITTTPAQHVPAQENITINYPYQLTTQTADMVSAKIMWNSVISTPGAKFGGAYIKKHVS